MFRGIFAGFLSRRLRRAGRISSLSSDNPWPSVPIRGWFLTLTIHFPVFGGRPELALGAVFARMFTTESARHIAQVRELLFASAVNSRGRPHAAKT